jgi:CRISPR/Cas system CSM-associated protein Csm3 (group 7 of RAMP superfamily)
MSPLSTIELTGLKVILKGPAHIGTGFARGLLNRTVVKGRDGLVYVPGSVLKGKARAACEALARLYQMSDCHAPHPQRMVGDRQSCVVCSIFGAPGIGSQLQWHMARLTSDWVEALRPNTTERGVFGQTIARTQVQLSRKRGMALESRLYASEFAMEGLTFEAAPAVTGRLPLTRVTVEDVSDVYYELILFLAGLKMIVGFGGGVSRGAGECELTLPENIKVNGQIIPVARQLMYAYLLEFYKDELEAQQ